MKFRGLVSCPDELLPDGPICPRCGGERAASGCGGGSWVHFDSTQPDRIVSSDWHQGVLIKQTLANGVIIRPKWLVRAEDL